MKTIKLITLLSASLLVGAVTGCDNRDMRQAAQTGSQAVGDTAITTKVKSALLAMPDLKSTDISVETMNGVVTLNGNVASQSQKVQVADSIRRIEGVKDVQNNLSVSAS